MNVTTFALLALLVASAAARESYPAPASATCIYQHMFDHGTLRITDSGVYKLCENIVFNPNAPTPGEVPPEDVFDPIYNGGWSPFEFGLGFFAAVAIGAPDVTIHLDGFTIEQSKEHALMQRFFAIFELATSPFIPGAGPALFVGPGEQFVPATNVRILGPGQIGRSSHHGIHGNENVDVQISAIDFVGFEVAAIALNNCDNVEISDNIIMKNRDDVPITGMFSAARFIRPYGKYLKSINYRARLHNHETGQVRWVNAGDAYDRLIASINNVYMDVINGGGFINATTHPKEHHLFDNPFRAVDGPCYAILVHGKGPAVGGMGFAFNDLDETVTSSNVVIRDNVINNIKCWNNEVPALFGACGNHGCIVNDVRGSVFQTRKTFGPESESWLALGPDGKYKGNVVSDMQIIVAQAILDGEITNIPSAQILPNSIHENVITWARDGGDLTPQYVCNGDSMHHVVKGIVVIRLEDTEGFIVEGNHINTVTNLSVGPFQPCTDFHIGASAENTDEYQAGNIRGISAAAVRAHTDGGASYIKNNRIFTATSENAQVIIGIDVQGESSGVEVGGNTVNLNGAVGHDTTDQYIAARIRSYVDGAVWFGPNNHFDEETVVDNTRRMRGRALQLAHSHVTGDIEWQVGGCPFAQEYAKKPLMA